MVHVLVNEVMNVIASLNHCNAEIVVRRQDVRLVPCSCFGVLDFRVENVRWIIASLVIARSFWRANTSQYSQPQPQKQLYVGIGILIDSRSQMQDPTYADFLACRAVDTYLMIQD